MFMIYGITDCPSCLYAQALLMEKDKEYAFVSMDFSPSYREKVKKDFDWETFPIVVLHHGEGDFTVIGGFYELRKSLLWDPMVGQST
jgi:glutaredoxin